MVGLPCKYQFITALQKSILHYSPILYTLAISLISSSVLFFRKSAILKSCHFKYNSHFSNYFYDLFKILLQTPHIPNHINHAKLLKLVMLEPYSLIH
ncbi:MAG: hypothetical protein LBR15_02410 [Methanobrevibacter sp.]|nr:hypothetical protein [Candidatus Methanovirga australis]